MKKSKGKIDDSLIDLVITDNYPVCKELGTLLKKLDSSTKWQVICAPKALEFSKKNDGFTDEYKPLYKINSKEIDNNAVRAKNIWVATCPDTRGDYLAFKINEHIKRQLKLNCSVYRMRLSCINEENVLNAILNKQNTSISKEVQLQYESYAVIDHAISTNVTKLLKEKFPFNFDVYLHTGILLDFIDNCTELRTITRKGFYNYITLYKDEGMSNADIKCSSIKCTKVSKVATLDSLYVGLSGFISWYGLASAINEAYSKGCITYPTSDSCRRTPKSIKIKGTKSSKKNWGLLWVSDDDHLQETSRSIVSEIHFQNLHKQYIHELQFKQGNTEYFIHKVLLLNNKEYETKTWKYLKISKSLGTDQLELYYYIKYLGFQTKLIPWIIYSLVKSGLVVYTTDCTVALTSLGKFLLMILRNNINVLLKPKYIINTLKGIKDLSIEDELKTYEFMQQRINKVTSLTEPAYEGLVAPKCSQKCSCGKRYSIVTSGKNVFATCSNNKCKHAGQTYPINIDRDKIEVIDE